MAEKKKGKKAAVVLAGGQGRRMNSAVPKQYLQLAGKPLLIYCLEAFEQSDVDEIILVTGPEALGQAREQVIGRFGLNKVSCVVSGGAERFHSVYAGLNALDLCELVLIHDSARPLVTADIINRTIKGALEYGACVAGMPVKDTIKRVDGQGFAEETLEREYLWQIQTPQAFSFRLLKRAYDWLLSDPSCQKGITDDAMVVERCLGIKAKLIMGGYENLKVTTPEDYIMAEALLKNRKIKSEKLLDKSR